MSRHRRQRNRRERFQRAREAAAAELISIMEELARTFDEHALEIRRAGLEFEHARLLRGHERLNADARAIGLARRRA
jgi:hypothetical protein